MQDIHTAKLQLHILIRIRIVNFVYRNMNVQSHTDT